jgi:hypothetical protein
MKTREEIKAEIKRIEAYRAKWPCSATVSHECDLMIQMLRWVLEEE